LRAATTPGAQVTPSSQRPKPRSKQGSSDGILNGRSDAMKTTIDKAGRVVIPKKIREAIGLKPGTELDVRLCDGRIEIEPEPLPIRLVERDGLLVVEPLVPVEPLTVEMVNAVLEQLRAERGSPH
jgi:AbrB family looped-hinge helix DNA binding protein